MENKLLEVNNLTKVFRKSGTELVAADDVSFSIGEGECVGLIGESGCGKSTVANLVAGFIRPDAGSISFDGKMLKWKGKEARTGRRNMQMVFQNPHMSLDPRMTIEENLSEAVIYYEKVEKTALKKRMEAGLEKMGLPADYLSKLPGELSGGECQRVAIARALMRSPDLLICDEVTSALDVSVQAEIMRYLMQLKREGISFLFITHDLMLAVMICDRIAVMKDGKIIETGNAHDIINEPNESYTKALVRALLE